MPEGQLKTGFAGSGRLRTVLLGVSSIVLMVIVGLSYTQWKRYNRANAEAAGIHGAVDSVEQLMFDLVDAETGQRGFLLTGEQRYLDSYSRSVARIPGDIAEANRRAPARQSQAAAVAQIVTLMDRRLGELRNAIAQRQDQGNTPAIAALSDAGEQTSNEIRALSLQIERQEHALEQQASKDGEAAAQVALLVTVGGAMVILFFFAIGFEPFMSRETGPGRRRWYQRYAAALFATAAATLLRMALGPLVGGGGNIFPYLTYIPAVLFAAWYGGFRAGAVTILTAALAAGYFFLSPLNTFRVRDPGELISMLIFVLVSFGVAFMTDSQRRAVARAEVAEDAERHERQRFEITLGSIGDAVIATDPQGNVTFANKVALSLVGLPEAAMPGQHLDEVFHIVNEYTRAAVESPVAKVLREGSVVGMANHTVLLARDGREVPIDDSAAPILNPDGRMEGTVLVFRDIAERRRAENAQQLLSSIVTSSADAMISHDLNGIVTSWNDAATRMFGYSAAEIVGKPISMLNDPEQADESAQTIERIRKGERLEQYHTLRRTKNNRAIHVSATVSPIYDGGGKVTGAARVTRDITAEVEAKEALADQRERLRVTLSSIGDAVITTDATGKTAYLNAVAEDLTGWRSEEAAGKPLEAVFRIIKEDTRETVENPAYKVLREGRTVGLANHTILIARNGRELAIDDSAAPIRNVRGETVGVVLIFRDITERRDAEKQMLQQSSELRRTNQELSQFAYVVSHDLREPLRNVLNFSELLVREYGGSGDSPAQTYAKFIQDSVHRMELLLNDLLAYSLLGKVQQPEEGLIDMNEVLRQAVHNLDGAITESGARITSEPLPHVAGSTTQLMQVLQNLIANAVKYRSAEPPRIRIGAEKIDGEWLFRVQDNGIGIDPKYQRLIFGVFKRLHGREIPGTGIGLAICSKVVESQGGRIWVESMPGEGSTFHFTLPAARESRATGA